MTTTLDSHPEPEQGSEAPSLLQIMVAEGDPVFRLGLKSGLTQYPHCQVVAEASSSLEALTILEQLAGQRSPADVPPEEAVPSPPVAQPLDLVILDLMEDPTAPNAGLALCQQLKVKYPSLPLLVLSGPIESAILLQLWQAGVEGCWLKGTNVPELVQILSQLVTGERVWHPQLRAQVQGMLAQSTSTPSLDPQGVGPFTLLWHHLRQSGVQEMERGLAQLEDLLQQPQLPRWQRWILEGQRREIRTAKALVAGLFPEPTVAPPTDLLTTVPPPTRSRPGLGELSPGLPPVALSVPASSAFDQLVSEDQFRIIKSLLLDRVLAKLPTSLQNATHEVLEIDILNPEKRQALFYIILRRFEEVLDELRFSQVQRSQLVQQESKILVDLWQATTADFFGKYLTLPLVRSSPSQSSDPVEIYRILIQDQVTVQAEVLHTIPQVVALLDHLLFQAPLVVDNLVCSVGSPEAVLQAEALLENLVVQMANAVVQPLLNHFATTEVIKQNFYDRRLISIREIERFRNALSWKYRWQHYITEPTHIFESQTSLFVFSEAGLKKISIYTAREHEFKDLKGAQLAVTLILETRDAIAPPLRSTFRWVGRGLVYILTQVVGRGIGLVGRGILQGIGNAWSERIETPKDPSPKSKTQ